MTDQQNPYLDQFRAKTTMSNLAINGSKSCWTPFPRSSKHLGKK